MTELNFTTAKLFSAANKIIEAYHKVLMPLCKETGLPPVAIDILMFIANNPENNTANNICRNRGLKSGIVSVHVDRLVNEGYLVRENLPNDRRKTLLVCTEKSQEIVDRGRKLQKIFSQKICENLKDDDLKAFHQCMEKIDENIEIIRKVGI
ncbi:MAG: MarR family winged helix-turn-helix transcriptional regulator [Erysipelotrichia bacterium]|nr:MarR family winged helix-turn-helix transcriptional regulator [Erysipelotrichia bacterium]